MNIKRFLALVQFRYLFQACRNDINLVSLHNRASNFFLSRSSSQHLPRLPPLQPSAPPLPALLCIRLWKNKSQGLHKHENKPCKVYKYGSVWEAKVGGHFCSLTFPAPSKPVSPHATEDGEPTSEKNPHGLQSILGGE